MWGMDLGRNNAFKGNALKEEESLQGRRGTANYINKETIYRIAEINKPDATLGKGRRKVEDADQI